MSGKKQQCIKVGTQHSIVVFSTLITHKDEEFRLEGNAMIVGEDLSDYYVCT